MVSLETTFKTIVADPPWEYPKGWLWERQKSRASSKYPTLTLQEICNLDVARFAKDNAYLFLWIPNRQLALGWQVSVMQYWGFTPISTWAGCKTRWGVGPYWRNSHENVVLGLRGSPGAFATGSWRSWDQWRWPKTPGKPEQFMEKVEANCEGPYLELFAKEQRPGWTAWGLEVGDPLNIGFDPDKW